MRFLGRNSLPNRAVPETGHQEDVLNEPRIPEQVTSSIQMPDQTESAIACFASHGSHGILDLGASKTVIGS